MVSFSWRDIPNQFPKAHYQIDVPWGHHLDSFLSQEPGTNLDPDYQRAHVWTSDQQSAYVEYALRGGETGKVLFWNCLDWGTRYEHPLELVDGKQRLQAVRLFISGGLEVFGHRLLDPSDLHPLNHCFQMRVCNLQSRAEVLRWYLAINAGGTPHNKTELKRVRELLKEEEKGK